MEGQLGHYADNQHEAGEEDAGRAIEAEFEELRDGEYPCSQVIGEEPGAGDAEANASGELDATRTQAVPVGVTRQADQVFCPYICCK